MERQMLVRQKAVILFCSDLCVCVCVLLECCKMLITASIRQNYLYSSIKVRIEDVFVPT